MKNALLVSIQETDVQIKNDLPNTHTTKATPLDTALKWTPLALLLLADAVGLKTKNKFKLHALQIIVAEAILNAALLPMKKGVNRQRPNGEDRSFPSGHSATGFLSSQILYNQLKESNTVLAGSGYAVSSATCVLRLYHNKHWFSDVAAGALLGVFSAKLAGKLINALKNKQTNKYLKRGNLLM